MLSTNTGSSTQEGLHANIRKLPSVEALNNDDFLNMFGDINTRPSTLAIRPVEAIKDRGLPPELAASPIEERTSEPYGKPVGMYEMAHSPVSPIHIQRSESEDQSRIQSRQTTYRSSVSSSLPSTKNSNASSRISRRTSISSLSEDQSSSDRSLKESEKESALHERLERRSKERRTSGYRASATNFSNMTRSRTSSSIPSSTQVSARESTFSSSSCVSPKARPLSRGSRLGQAMAGGALVSPPPTHLTRSGPNTALNEQQSPSLVNHLAGPIRLRRVLNIPPMADVDNVRVGIMSKLDDLQDLQSCAQICRDFYQTFQRYETLLVDCVLFNQSPAAWELRYSVRHLEKPSPFRLRSVLRDYATVHALEDFMVWKCQLILRSQSLAAFLSQDTKRKAELEDAIWMVWSFCNTFGKTSMSDGTLQKQIQWLNGETEQTQHTSEISRVTRGACTTRHLEDMSEIWRCLENLLSGFRSREDEARQAGVFDRTKKTTSSDKELLTAWIDDVLSLGPKAVLTLSSCDFEQARVLGITKWSPPSKGKSRANFLKGAVEEVYRDRLMKLAKQKALDYRNSIRVQHQHKRSTSDPAHMFVRVTTNALTHRHSALPGETQKAKPAPQRMSLQVPLIATDPLEIRPDCDPLSPLHNTPILSPGSNPTIFSPLTMTKNVSTRLGATLFPMQNRDQSQRFSIGPSNTSRVQSSNKITTTDLPPDPTDEAMILMVREMGYREPDARRALAMSDTGAGIDVEVAVEILSAGSSQTRPKRKSQLCELPGSLGETKIGAVRVSPKREICEGNCKPILLVEPRRDRVSGLGMVKRRLSYRMSLKKSTKLSVIPDAEETISSPPRTGYRAAVNGNAHDTTLNQLTSSTISAFTVPILPRTVSSLSGTQQPLTTVHERPETLPPLSMTHQWSRRDAELDSSVQIINKHEEFLTHQELKPRIKLQRVGTGVTKTGFSLSALKKKEHTTEPEIIGYTY